MKHTITFRALAATALCAATLAASGCGFGHCGCARNGFYNPPGPPPHLGSVVDKVFQLQEERSEATEFIIYDSEFALNTARLNDYGREHVKQIAMRLQAGQNFPVVVEQNRTGVKETTQYKFPIHEQPQLDLLRREVIVRSLTALGVQEADERVSVARSFTPGYTATEAQQAYFSTGFGSIFGGSGFGGFGFGR